MIPLDSIVPLHGEVALLKTDVQGHEHEVLQGMHSLLSRRVPKCILYESDPAMVTRARFNVDGTLATVEYFGYVGTRLRSGETLCAL